MRLPSPDLGAKAILRDECDMTPLPVKAFSETAPPEERRFFKDGVKRLSTFAVMRRNPVD
jgi:hypothetical protein